MLVGLPGPSREEAARKRPPGPDLGPRSPDAKPWASCAFYMGKQVCSATISRGYPALCREGVAVSRILEPPWLPPFREGPALLQGSMMAAARMDPAQVSDGFSGIDASQVVRSGHLGKLEAKKSPGRLCSCHLFIAVLRL